MRAFILAGLTATAFSLAACEAGIEVDPDGPKVAAADFKALAGKGWSGELNYLDYSSDQRVSIPTEAVIKLAGRRGIKYTISYPKEPWENTKATLKISRSGRVFDKHPVISRETMPDGRLIFQTQSAGEDDGKPAEIRTTYRVGPNAFAIEKDVRFSADEAFVNRNVYRLTRSSGGPA